MKNSRKISNSKCKLALEDVARVLRLLRKKKRLTQKEVARELQISQGKVSKMENAILEPSATQWMEFCQLMGVRMSFAYSHLAEDDNGSVSIRPAVT